MALFPKFEAETAYDDNIFRTRTAPSSDTVLRSRPSVAIRSDWDNHSLALSAEAEFGRNERFSGEDYEDYRTSAGGRIDITEDWALSPRIGYERFHQARGDPDDAGASAGVTIGHRSEAGLDASYTGAILDMRANGLVRGIDYDDNGSTDNDDRDRTETSFSLRIGVAVDTGTIFFIEPKINAVTYKQAVDNNGVRRDSDGYEVLAGVNWDVSGVTFLEFSAGFLEQHYEEPSFSTTRGYSANASMVWNPTDLMTLTFDLGRKINETTLAGVSGILDTTVSLRLDYELFDNLMLDSSASLVKSEFQGNNRTDDSLNLGFGATYSFGENWFSALKYERTSRESNSASASFTSNSFLARLGVQF